MKYKKVLYALQGTGNGHVSRAREIIPILQKYCDLDVWIGGTESEVELPFKPNFQKRGLVMIYNRTGGVSYWKTLIGNNYINIIRDLLKAPVKDYDLIINDFEFLTSWACKIRGVRCLQVSHQAAFRYTDTPRPANKNWLGEFILKYYATGDEYIGFHFFTYHPNIYLPVIRAEIQKLSPKKDGHITVYLPAFHHEVLIDELQRIEGTIWHVFSKFTDKSFQYNNVLVQPVNNERFINSFESCEGVFCGAGFETPAEALYMGKKVLAMPIHKQYEQYCNAAALREEGVSVINEFNERSRRRIRRWLAEPNPQPRDIPNYIENLLVSILSDTRKPSS